MAYDTTVEDTTTPEAEEAANDEAQAETHEAADEEVQAQDDNADDESQNDETEAQSEPEPEKKGGRASERIQQLIAEKKAAEAELEQMRRQSQQPKQTSSSDGAPVKPSIDDYDLESEDGLDKWFEAQAKYDEEYQDWKLDQRLQQREQSKQQEQRNAAITDSFNARFEANPEFKANFQKLAILMQDKPVEADPSELYAGDDLMDILEHVAADPDLYYELADMPKAKQYAEFGRIHATIQAKKGAPKVARQSKAPAPPNHTKANAPIKRDPYSQSDDDFMRSRGF